MNRVVVICRATASVSPQQVQALVTLIRSMSGADDITVIEAEDDARDPMLAFDRLRYVDAGIVIFGPPASRPPVLERADAQRLLERYAQNGPGLVFLRLPGSVEATECLLGLVRDAIQSDFHAPPFSFEAPFNGCSNMFVDGTVKRLLQWTETRETASGDLEKNRRRVLEQPAGLREFFVALTSVGWTAPTMRPWTDSADLQWLDDDPRGTALSILEDAVAWSVLERRRVRNGAATAVNVALRQIPRPATFEIDDLQTPIMTRAAARGLPRENLTAVADGLVRLENWARQPKSALAPIVFVCADVQANVQRDLVRAHLRASYEGEAPLVRPTAVPLSPLDLLLVAVAENYDPIEAWSEPMLGAWHAGLDRAWYQRPASLPVFFIDGHRDLGPLELAQKAQALQTASPRAIGVVSIQQAEMPALVQAAGPDFKIVSLTNKKFPSDLADARAAFSDFRTMYERAWNTPS